jgi:EmrB/QacA subfamily drug resistance transporter
VRALPAVLAVALFMENMDSTVIATALPTIAADLGASPVALKLALTSYYVALGVFIPVSGRIADRWGAKDVFRAAIVVFMAGSLACAWAGSLEGFVAARFLQGVGGAMMTPVARLLLVRGTPRSELISAMAWFTVPALVGPLLGPPLGGAIATWGDWRWIFFVNLPIGAVGLAAVGRFVPAVPRDPAARIDGRGFLLSGAACAGLVFGFSLSTLPVAPGWLAAALVAGGAAAAGAYLRHARSRPDPLLRLSLLRDPTFRAAFAGVNLFRVGVGATPFLTPLFLQLAFGVSPFLSGLVAASAVGGAIVMKVAAKPILTRFGFRRALVATALLGGATIVPVGFWHPSVPLAALAALMLAGGFFRSLMFTGANALAYAEVAADRAGDATALSSAAQQVSIASGVALASALLEVGVARDGALDAGDFAAAYVVVGATAAAAALFLRRLPDDAGAVTLGRGAAGAAPRAGDQPTISVPEKK